MNDVHMQLRAANPVPRETSYPPEDVARNVAAVLGRRRSRGPLLVAAAVAVTAALACGVVLATRPDERPAAGGDPVTDVTVQCRAGSGDIPQAQLDRAVDVVQDRLLAAGIHVAAIDSSPSSGYVDVTVPDTRAADAMSACRSTSVHVHTADTGVPVVDGAGIAAAAALPAPSGHEGWTVTVSFTRAAAAAIRREVHHRLALAVGPTGPSLTLPALGAGGSVTISGAFSRSYAQQLADDIAGAALGLRPVP